MFIKNSHNPVVKFLAGYIRYLIFKQMSNANVMQIMNIKKDKNLYIFFFKASFFSFSALGWYVFKAL